MSESHRWREAGQRLATLRDGAVLRETFDQVVADSGDGMPANDIAVLRSEIVRGSAEADTAETKRVLRSVLSDLRGAKRRLATLNWPETADDLGRGLRASQSRLRKSWRRARRDRTPEALHHWRKRVKDQSAQLRLLRIVAPQEAKARREVQKQVAEFLGDEHDLCLLAERLSCAAIPPRVEPVRTHLLEAVKKQRKALRRRAFKAAEEGCSEKPGAFAAHLERRLEDGVQRIGRLSLFLDHVENAVPVRRGRIGGKRDKPLCVDVVEGREMGGSEPSRFLQGDARGGEVAAPVGIQHPAMRCREGRELRRAGEGLVAEQREDRDRLGAADDPHKIDFEQRQIPGVGGGHLRHQKPDAVLLRQAFDARRRRSRRRRSPNS